MRGKTDIVKGRIKEAAGALTNSEKLRAKGRKDQAVGRVEVVVEREVRLAKKSASDLVTQAKNAAREAVTKAKKGKLE